MEPARRTQSACRSLFGPVDRDLLRRELTQRLRDMSEEDSLRWNFNFQTETPLPGRFEWEEMSADCVAAHYQERAPLQDALRCPRADTDDDDDEEERTGTDQDQDQENCSSVSNTRTRPAEVTPVPRKRARAVPVRRPNNNARIPDFFAKRRRSTETKSRKCHVLTDGSESAPCKTIR